MSLICQTCDAAPATQFEQRTYNTSNRLKINYDDNSQDELAVSLLLVLITVSLTCLLFVCNLLSGISLINSTHSAK